MKVSCPMAGGTTTETTPIPLVVRILSLSTPSESRKVCASAFACCHPPSGVVAGQWCLCSRVPQLLEQRRQVGSAFQAAFLAESINNLVGYLTSKTIGNRVDLDLKKEDANSLIEGNVDKVRWASPLSLRAYVSFHR